MCLGILLLASCKEKPAAVEDDSFIEGTVPKNNKDNIYCYFLYCDGINDQLTVIYYHPKNSEDNRPMKFSLGLSRNQGRLSFSEYVEKYKIRNVIVNKKGEQLAETLEKNAIRYNIGADTPLHFPWMGISGPILLYADKVISDRQAGEDLSDMFDIWYRGRIKYPEMELDMDCLDRSVGEKVLKDYCAIGTIPIIGVEGIYDGQLDIAVHKQYSLFFDQSVTLHLEIPVTGLFRDGQEKSMVLTATIP